MRLCITFISLVFFAGCAAGQPDKEDNPNAVATGAEVLIAEHLDSLMGKRVGLVMNPTARIQNVHMLDTLLALGVEVTALFAPEHGFRGTAGAGETIEDGIDRETGLPVFSLYGEIKRPSPDMLELVDILLFDMQDVGARFYTYNVTMKYVVEAAAEAQKEVWILDRPNPAGGNYVSGWVMREPYFSFVGAYTVPMVHGLTLGELALMAEGEGWFENDKEIRLKVIKMKGWQRSMLWPDTGLEWYPPSPNLPTFEHAFFYLGTVLFEGTSLSEGRGTPDPFLTIGGPDVFLSREKLDNLSAEFKIGMDTVTFVPASIPGKSSYPKHEEVLCRGIKITDAHYLEKTDPVKFGVSLLATMLENSETAEVKPFINNLAGINLKKILEEKHRIPSWDQEVKDFLKKREPYLLY